MLCIILLDGTIQQSKNDSCLAGIVVLRLRCRNFDLEDVHVEGAERIAEAVAKYDVDRFIHVSSYNADKDSPSEFFRVKVRPIKHDILPTISPLILPPAGSRRRSRS